MPNADWNVKLWNTVYDWEETGEEWSAAWGNSYAQFYAELFPRLANLLPARNVLEIAPGFGRWTQYILKYTLDRFTGVDISAKCVEHCRTRFQECDFAHFHVNDGKDLSRVDKNSVDLAFSFDSLVHVDVSVLDSYVRQLLEKLKATGVAFIHHSNLGALPEEVKNINGPIATPHNRDDTVTADLVREQVIKYGGTVYVQEIIDWGGYPNLDCLTTFGRSNEATPTKSLNNQLFMEHARYAKQILSHYSNFLPPAPPVKIKKE